MELLGSEREVYKPLDGQFRIQCSTEELGAGAEE
jgi:hypothetical protein